MNPLRLLLVISVVFLSLPPVESRDASSIHKRVIDHWSVERQRAAIPRDLVIDHRGLGYLKGKGGVLIPYGHTVKADVDARFLMESPVVVIQRFLKSAIWILHKVVILVLHTHFPQRSPMSLASSL